MSEKNVKVSDIFTGDLLRTTKPKSKSNNFSSKTYKGGEGSLKKIANQNNKNENANKVVDESLLLTYVGKNYYKIISKHFSFPGFFFGGMYLMYRKMYLTGGILYLLTSLLGFYTMKITEIDYMLALIIYLIMCLVIGAGTNQLYINSAAKEVHKIKENNPNASKAELQSMCRRSGGTNISFMILLVVILGLASSLLADSLFGKANEGMQNIKVNMVSAYNHTVQMDKELTEKFNSTLSNYSLSNFTNN